jgi:translation elongation factor EF-G
MIKFNKPNQLNGLQLRQELNASGVKIDNEVNAVSIDGNGDLWLDIAKKDEAKAKLVVEAHVGVDQSAAQEAAKKAILDRIGLTADELKTILG